MAARSAGKPGGGLVWRSRSASVYGATSHCVGVLGGVGAAGEARELSAAGVAQRVHEEQAVLGGGVAEPEHRAVAVAAVDVRDAEALVAHDRDVAARGVAALDVARAARRSSSP